ncbi:MAG TPA: 4Fe-4S binding protein, partial [Spirochaetia bacterium]|nr:4Fe-4S binding protein [Spirochaetia bacterium]
LKVVKTDPQVMEERIPLVVSIGYTPQEVSRLGAIIEREVHPDAFEFSTHYTGKSVQPLLDVAKALRDAVQCPIWMKVSPNFPDMRELAVAASALVDGFVAINSFGPVLDFDMETGAPLLGSGDGQGWLSGPPIMPIALRIVHQLAALQEKPVIGVGGISSGADALKFIMAGASLVQVCSAALNHGHGVYGKIAKEMDVWLDGHDYRSLDQIRGLYGRKLLERKAFRELPVMAIDEEQCTGCSACVGRCIHGALSMRPAGPDGGGGISKKEKGSTDHPIAQVKPELCIGCGFCRSFCAYSAMALRES